MTDYLMKVNGHFENGESWSWAWDITSAQTPSALTTTVVAALTDMWTNGTYGLNSQYPTTTIMDSVDVITLDGTYRHKSKTTGALALPGTSSDNGLPNNTSMIIHKQSPGLQRYQRGFSRFPAPVEGIVVNGVFTGTAVTRFGNATRALRNAIAADGSTVFVHLGKTAAKDGTPAYSKTVITTVEASNKPGTVRARTRKFKPVLG